MPTSARSRVRRYVFDLDGTLFDTKELVKEAYLRAGVRMPEDAWGLPVASWLPQMVGRNWKFFHSEKTAHYIKLLHSYPPVRSSAASAMIELVMSGVECFIVTGASPEAAKALLSGFQPYHYRLIGTQCDLEQKTMRVKNLGQGVQTVYVDDDEDACHHIAEAVGCRGMVYRYAMTKEEVMEPWVQSYSQQDAESA